MTSDVTQSAGDGALRRAAPRATPRTSSSRTGDAKYASVSSSLGARSPVRTSNSNRRQSTTSPPCAAASASASARTAAPRAHSSGTVRCRSVSNARARARADARHHRASSGSYSCHARIADASDDAAASPNTSPESPSRLTRHACSSATPQLGATVSIESQTAACTARVARGSSRSRRARRTRCCIHEASAASRASRNSRRHRAASTDACVVEMIAPSSSAIEPPAAVAACRIATQSSQSSAAAATSAVHHIGGRPCSCVRRGRPIAAVSTSTSMRAISAAACSARPSHRASPPSRSAASIGASCVTHSARSAAWCAGVARSHFAPGSGDSINYLSTAFRRLYNRCF